MKRRARPWQAPTWRDLRHHPVVATGRSLARRLGLWATRQIALEALSSIWRNRVATLFAILIIALSLATVGAFLLVGQNLSQLVGRATSLELTVFLKDGTPADAAEHVRAAIQADRAVVKATAVSPAEALETFRRLNPDLQAIPEALGENPFPPTIEIELSSAARAPEQLQALADRVEQLEHVERIGTELEIAQRAAAAGRLLTVIATALGAVLVLAALFTVATVVRMTIYARRSEIELLQLVGATDAYVRATFIAEGVLEGLAGSLLGTVLLFIAYRTVIASLGPGSFGILGTIASRFLTPGSTTLLMLSGGLLGGLGSLVPLRGIRR